MKVTIFDTHHFEQKFLAEANIFHDQLDFVQPILDVGTAKLAEGSEAVCLFVHDKADAKTLNQLCQSGIKYIVLRCAGYNNIDLKAAKELGFRVARVPEYSPYAVAEHTVGLMLALNRKLYKAYNRVRELNFSLEGLVGFDMHDKTVGIIGTGKIGHKVVKILHGFGCKLLAYDIQKDESLCKNYNLKYTSLDELFKNADIITLHAPLTPHTHYLIGQQAIEKMKNGVMLINTSRGGLLDTKAVINALKAKKISYLGLDVYEEEENVFFEDHSLDIIQDDTLARLLTFPNVLITSHQAFLTETALQHIAKTTMQNLQNFINNEPCPNELTWE